MVYVQTYESYVFDYELNESLSSSFKSFIKKLRKSVGVQVYLALAYGTSIEALYNLFMTYIKTTELISLDNVSVSLLFVCAVSVFVNRSKPDAIKLYKIIKKKGISQYLKSVVEFLKNIFKIAKKVLENLGKTVSGVSELLGYISIFAPIVIIIKDFLTAGNINLSDYPGAITSVGVGLGALSIKTIVDYVMEELKSRKKI